jgi:hypothetical protein
MTQAERRDFIAKRPPAAQKVILAKVLEYEGLQPDQRELRLRVTELRWYLLPLMSTPATNRTARLSAIPDDELRELVEARLRQWDELEPPVQRALLDNESTLRFYFELAARTAGQRAVTITNMPLPVNDEIESGIRRWQALTNEQRQEIARHFREFFDFTSGEKTKILNTLSKSERLQIEKTYQTFESLSPTLRNQCLRSFQKFISLSPDERRQFLQNAERWERMTPAERQTWRNLVSTFANLPPLPGNLGGPPAPPAPPTPHAAAASASLLTNAN